MKYLQGLQGGDGFTLDEKEEFEDLQKADNSVYDNLKAKEDSGEELDLAEKATLRAIERTREIIKKE